MKRIAVIAGVAVLALLLAGCNAFFAGREGRFNPLDPDNELVKLSSSLDGYVDTDSFNDTGSILYAELDIKATLIRFPADKLPEDIGTAYLRIYKQSTPSADISIYPVLASSPPLNLSDVQPGVFYNDAAVQYHTLASSSGWEQIELAEFFPGSADIISRGIVILSDTASIINQFGSSEAGFAPQLLVEPR